MTETREFGERDARINGNHNVEENGEATGDNSRPVAADSREVVWPQATVDSVSPYEDPPPMATSLGGNLSAVEAPVSTGALAPPLASPVDADGGARTASEYMVLLLIAAMVFRAFIAEAYLVPSGSMAPTLMGFHKKVECPDCGLAFAIGVEENQGGDFPCACPNCSRAGLEIGALPLSSGDRLLVHKGVFTFRRPRRWEPIVFRHPTQPTQAYVKRAVGLPGEEVRIVEGDVYINGMIARKTFAELRDMARLVYEYRPTPRFDREKKNTNGENPAQRLVPESSASAWKWEGHEILFDDLQHPPPSMLEVDPKSNTPLPPTATFDVLTYFHRDYQRRRAPLRDTEIYNGERQVWEENATDLLLRLQMEYLGGKGALQVVMRPTRRENYTLRYWPHDGKVELWRNDVLARSGITPLPANLRADLEVAFYDQRVAVRLNNQAPFADLDLPDEWEARPIAPPMSDQPVALGAHALRLCLSRFRLERDIVYTSRMSGVFQLAGVNEPYQLGPDEYFALGDNSAVSNDSRLWQQPAVPAHLLIGKPILVHLPASARVWHTRVFGRQIQYAVPDLGKVRRVH